MRAAHCALRTALQLCTARRSWRWRLCAAGETETRYRVPLFFMPSYLPTTRFSYPIAVYIGPERGVPRRWCSFPVSGEQGNSAIYDIGFRRVAILVGVGGGPAHGRRRRGGLSLCAVHCAAAAAAGRERYVSAEAQTIQLKRFHVRQAEAVKKVRAAAATG